MQLNGCHLHPLSTPWETTASPWSKVTFNFNVILLRSFTRINSLTFSRMQLIYWHDDLKEQQQKLNLVRHWSSFMLGGKHFWRMPLHVRGKLWWKASERKIPSKVVQYIIKSWLQKDEQTLISEILTLLMSLQSWRRRPALNNLTTYGITSQPPLNKYIQIACFLLNCTTSMSHSANQLAWFYRIFLQTSVSSSPWQPMCSQPIARASWKVSVGEI